MLSSPTSLTTASRFSQTFRTHALRSAVVILTALCVVATDFVTSHWALSTLIPGAPSAFGPFTLLLQSNAGNVTNEAPASLSTLWVTHGVLALFAVWVALHPSRLAWLGAGLMLGGSTANLVAALTPPHVVPDFVVVAHLVANPADFAIVIGILLTVFSFYRPTILFLRRRTLTASRSGPSSPAQYSSEEKGA